MVEITFQQYVPNVKKRKSQPLTEEEKKQKKREGNIRYKLMARAKAKNCRITFNTSLYPNFTSIPNDSRYGLLMSELPETYTPRTLLEIFSKKTMYWDDQPALLSCLNFYIGIYNADKGPYHSLSFKQAVPFWLLFGHLFLSSPTLRSTNVTYPLSCPNNYRNSISNLKCPVSYLLHFDFENEIVYFEKLSGCHNHPETSLLDKKLAYALKNQLSEDYVKHGIPAKVSRNKISITFNEGSKYLAPLAPYVGVEYLQKYQIANLRTKFINESASKPPQINIPAPPSLYSNHQRYEEIKTEVEEAIKINNPNDYPHLTTDQFFERSKKNRSLALSIALKAVQGLLACDMNNSNLNSHGNNDLKASDIECFLRNFNETHK